MMSDKPWSPPFRLDQHQLAVARRRRERERYDRMCLRVRWLCAGVLLSWLILGVVTLAHCASPLGRCSW